MPWQETAAHGGFTTGSPWIEVADEHRALAVDRQDSDIRSNLNFVRGFLTWRKDQPLLIFGGERVRVRSDDVPVIVWDRYGGDQMLTCVANFSLEAQAWPHVRETFDAMIFSSDDRDGRPRDSAGVLMLPPLGFAILARQIDEETAKELL